MLENATRICEAKFGNLFRFDGTDFQLAAEAGAPPELIEFLTRRGAQLPIPGSLLDRVMQTKQACHTADIIADAIPSPGARFGGARSAICVPMLKDDVLVGAIFIYRTEVSPFTDKQIELVKNFAAQAVIAIENTRLLSELRESLEQQTATSKVLRVISSSPGELEPVFQAMLENAVHICGANFGNIYRWSGDALHLLATHNTPPAFAEARRNSPFRPGPDTPTGRMVATKAVTQVADLAAEPRFTEQDDRDVRFGVGVGGIRTLLSVPMLKEDELIGAITIYRQEVRPFTDKQVDLVANFAAQAVIAIENTRLLNELRQRTGDLSEALEQQTATSEVLRVVSTSPGDMKPVFEAMLANALRICEAKFGHILLYDGERYHAAHLHNVPLSYREFWEQNGPIRPGPNTGLARLARTKQVAHIPDLKADSVYASEREPLRVVAVDHAGARTFLAAPMIKDDQLIGAIVIYRQEVRPFTDKQIALVQNFAAQAVIAIENTRLLNELRKSLEQQTATSEVLSVISSSPGELEPVFQAMLANATHICEAKFGNLLLYDGNGFHVRAMHNAPPAWNELRRRDPSFHPGPKHPLARMAESKQLQHITDLKADKSYLERDPTLIPIVDLAGARTALVVPMLKEGELVGAIVIYRQEVRPFTDKQIALVQNFAAQAVIAIENTRLLNELRQSLEQQTATAEVLGVISSSPGELEPVFRAMLENATHICEAKFGVLYLFDGEMLAVGAEVETPPKYAEFQKQRGRFQPTPGVTSNAFCAPNKRIIPPMPPPGMSVCRWQRSAAHDHSSACRCSRTTKSWGSLRSTGRKFVHSPTGRLS